MGAHTHHHAPPAHSKSVDFDSTVFRKTSASHQEDHHHNETHGAHLRSPPPKAKAAAGGHHDEVAAKIILAPKDVYYHIADAGAAKATLPLARSITLGVLAGFYISFSFMLTLIVGGQLGALNTTQYNLQGLYNLIFGSIGFPLGLTIICVVGADLFTSTTMYCTVAVLEGRMSLLALIKAWIIAWFSNLCGALFMAQLCIWAELYEGRSAPVIALSLKKCNHPFGVVVARGIICNWLVNLAVWMANGAQDMTGKAVAIYLPISAFVSLGMEHCIANQYLHSVAYMLGSGLTVNQIIYHNLFPATLGNIIGGAGFVATFYAAAYGQFFDVIWAQWLRVWTHTVPEHSRQKFAHATEPVVHAYDYAMLHTWPAPPLPRPAPPSALQLPSKVAAMHRTQSGTVRIAVEGGDGTTSASSNGTGTNSFHHFELPPR